MLMFQEQISSRYLSYNKSSNVNEVSARNSPFNRNSSKMTQAIDNSAKLSDAKDIELYESDGLFFKNSPSMYTQNRNSALHKNNKKIDDYSSADTNYNIQIIQEMNKTRKLCSNYRISKNMTRQ